MTTRKPISASVVHQPSHIRELDGVRGIAALAVFFHHAASSTLPSSFASHANVAIRLLMEVSRYGRYGVDLFFVLSGYLITSILLRDARSDSYYRDFYWKRALRVLPVYLLCLTALLFVAHQVGYVVLSLMFLANFAIPLRIAANGPFWSLAIEEQFYLLWPTVVRRRSYKRLAWFAAALAAMAFFGRFLVAAFGHYNYDLTPLRCDGLALGALLAIFLHNKQHDARVMRNVTAALGSAFLAGLVFLGITLRMEQSLHKEAFAQAFNEGGVVLLSISIVGFCVVCTGATWLALLRSRLLFFFGLISYAFYMFHLYVIQLYDKRYGAPAIGDNKAFLLRFSLTLLGSIGLSLASRYLLELPVLRLRKRVLKHPSPVTDTPLPLANQ